MMQSNMTSRIVIGVGLLAIFGVGASVVLVRAKQEEQRVALAAPAAPAELAAPTDAAAPPPTADAPTATDQSTSPPAETPAVPPASDLTNNTAAAPAVTEPAPVKPKSANRRAASARSSDDSAGIRVASAGNPSSIDSAATAAQPASSAAATDATPALSASAADTQQAQGQSADAGASAGTAATGNSRVMPDSEITSAVRSEIGTAAPGSSVAVTTTNGVVSLAGSVPSQESIDRVKQAAEAVPGVSTVDASGLTVSNQ